MALILARAGHDVHLWSRNEHVVESINSSHRNEDYFREYLLPPNIVATASLQFAIHDAQIVVLAAPSHVIRSLLMAMQHCLVAEMVLVSAAKGIEIESRKRISEIAKEIVGVSFNPRFVCLSGPSFAREVAEGHPTAVVAEVGYNPHKPGR
jgi:glycerol-3-phosphate dehydrogenase (NAD(P)+)